MRSIRDKFLMVGISLVVVAVAFIPSELFLLARLVFSPQGFWQNFFFLGAGVFFLGIAQLILLVFVIIFLLKFWTD